MLANSPNSMKIGEFSENIERQHKMYYEYQNLHIVCKIGFGFQKSDSEHKNLLLVLEIVIELALS